MEFSVHTPPPGSQHCRRWPDALVDVDVLHRDLLLAFAAGAIERIKQHRMSAGPLAWLKFSRRPLNVCSPSMARRPIAFHRSVMGGDKLCRDHAFRLVSWRESE